MLMSTKVVWNIDCTVMLDLLFWQFLYFTLFLMVMTFVMNIGDDLHWLSLRCCCLYFKWHLPLLLCFFCQKLL